MIIKLNFINQAQLTGADLPTVLLFQKQVDEDGGEQALVWKVIRHCRTLHFRPLTFSTDLRVSLGDEFGNFSALVPACPGDEFEVQPHNGRGRISLGRERDADDAIVVQNRLPDAAFHACLFVRKELLARQRGLPFGGQVRFAAEPTLWVGVARRGADDDLVGPCLPGQRAQWREGSPVSQRVMDEATPIDLEGVACANIVMRTGSKGLTFTREGTVWA